MSYSIQTLLVRCSVLAGRWRLTHTHEMNRTSHSLSRSCPQSLARLIEANATYVRRSAYRFNKIKWNRLRCAACGPSSLPLLAWGLEIFLMKVNRVVSLGIRIRSLFTIRFCSIHKSIRSYGIHGRIAAVIRHRQKRVTFCVSLRRQSHSFVSCIVNSSGSNDGTVRTPLPLTMCR